MMMMMRYINNLFKMFLDSQDYYVDSYIDACDTLNTFKKSEYNLGLLDVKMEKINESNYCENLIDNNIIICLIKKDKDFILLSKDDKFYTEKNIIYKPILLRDLKNKVNSLLSLNKDKLLTII